MRRRVLHVAAVLVGSVVLLASLSYLSAPGAAAAVTAESVSSQSWADAAEAEPMRRRPTHTRTPTPTRTPTSVPTNTPVPSATPTPGYGADWRINSVPGSATALIGVDVLSANDVWAVGYDQSSGIPRTFAMHWDGTAWTVAPTPNVGTGANSLHSVSAVSSNDVWAVGYWSARTLTMHWDGTAWSIVSSPNPGLNENYLLGVAAVSANDVWAVGYYRSGPPYVALVMRWNGSAWNVVPSPVPNMFAALLTSVAVVSANDVWAVGYTYETSGSQAHTLTMHWDGSAWTVVPSPPFNQLYSISAVSSNDVWAVGSTGVYPIAIHWNGTSWTTAAIPEPPTEEVYLNGVSAVSANNAWAVGYFYSFEEARHVSWILRWDGSAWSRVPSPNADSANTLLYRVGAASASNVWAMGYTFDGTYRAHLQRYHDPCAKSDP
ncbi:MAG TPA: hypothetical protein VFR15_08760 [Chloroflexia bacterium]|nr:hypothetical protein [Chloroflexia bacterium]